MYLDTVILVVVSFVELLEACVYGTFNMAPANVCEIARYVSCLCILLLQYDTMVLGP